MRHFDLAQLLTAREESGRLYHEFLRVPSLSAGIYELAAGATDPQKPHGQDELYYVLRGSGSIRVGEEDQALQAGSLVYVPARMPHHFHTITETLTLLVLFAPAEEDCG